MDVNIKLNNYIDNKMKNIRLSENTFKKYKKNSLDILLSKSELTDTDVKNHKKMMENKKNILDKTSGTDTSIKRHKQYVEIKDKKLSSLSKTNYNNQDDIFINDKLLSNSSFLDTIAKAERKEKDKKNEEKLKKELQEIVSSTNLNIRNQLSDFELCSQLNKLSETTGGTIKTIKSDISKISEKSIKKPKTKKPKNYNYFDMKLYIKNKKIKKKDIDILYKRLYKRRDKIKNKLIEKKIIKNDVDDIPYKMLFQLYINDLKDDLELKIC